MSPVAHLPMIKRMAWQLVQRTPASVDMRDLVQAALLRLCMMGARVDAQNDGAEAFVASHVRGAMRDELRAADLLPRAVREQLNRVDQARRQLVAAEQRANLSAVAQAADLPRRTVARLLVLEALSQSTQQGGNDQAIEQAPCPAPTPEQACEESQSLQVLRRAIETLRPQLRTVVEAQLAGEEQAYTAKRLGVHPSCVSQMRKQALLALRARLRPVFGQRV